jgi:hypothetical protein
VRRRSTATIVAAFLLLPIVSASGLVSVAQSALATSCCAATDYSCAGFRAPDDCCKKMGHSAGAPVAASVERSAHLAPAESAIVVVQPSGDPALTSFGTIATPAGTRLHDPPHLHTFPLLI